MHIVNKIIYVFIFLIFVIFLYKILTRENFTDYTIQNIPKIIHQTAPKDKTKWNEIWFKCQESWMKHFPTPEYEYKMWTDEDLDNLVKENYNWFYDVYKNYDKNIKRIDIGRCFVLHKYGGIYADMDYECFKNFYDILDQTKISLVRSPYSWEYLQNALMVSPPNKDFWIKLINKSKERSNDPNVLYSTGPQLLSDVFNENKNDCVVLPVNLFNPCRDDIVNKNILYTKHHGTYSWNEKK
jgi:mannosyltransferase OCH1-like enzyme